MENMNWAVIIAAIISFGASLITIYKSSKIQTSAMKINEQLANSQMKTQDKQRIVGNIGAQRIEWVNKTRDVFIGYNANLNKLRFINSILNDNNISRYHDEIKKLSFELSKSKDSVELLLNPNEPYTKFLIVSMEELNKIVIGNRKFKDDRYKKLNNYIIFAQNVILKAEWKRVKDETERGQFLNDKEMETIFEVVGSSMNKETHNLIMGKYRILD